MKNHLITSADGVQHQLMLSGKPENDNQPIVLCLPAMGVPARKYLSLAQSLNNRGLASAVLEWRGIETSNVRASRRQNYGYHEILNLDIPAAVSFIRQFFPQNPCYLLGHSLGGQLGMLYMTRNPDLISGHIGVATGLPFYKAWSFPQNIGLWSASFLMRAIAYLVGHYPGRKLGFAGREARQMVSDWAYSVVNGDFRVAGERFNVVESQARRSLFISIENDLFAPQSSTRQLANKLNLTPVTFCHLKANDFKADSLGHFKWLREPDPVVEQIIYWLEARASE